MMCHNIGCEPTGIMRFGIFSEYSRIRVPRPPQKSTTFIGATPRIRHAPLFLEAYQQLPHGSWCRISFSTWLLGGSRFGAVQPDHSLVFPPWGSKAHIGASGVHTVLQRRYPT